MLDDLYSVLTKFIVLQLETYARNGIFKLLFNFILCLAIWKQFKKE